MEDGRICWYGQGAEEPSQTAPIGFSDGLFRKLRHLVDDSLGLTGSHVIDDSHIPEMHCMAGDVLFTHVLRNIGFCRKVAMGK